MKKPFESSYRRVFNTDLFKSVAAHDLGTSDHGTKRLLVVEDDPDARAALQVGLSDAYEITTVADGDAALAMLDTHRFDLMLVDLKVPGALLRELRTGRVTIPTVVACETFALTHIVKETGAACLMKPLSLGALEARLSFVMAEGFGLEPPTARSSRP